MDKYGPWRIPLGISNRLRLYFLKLVSRYSWLADGLRIPHADDTDRTHATLFTYLKKNGLVDGMTEKALRHPGYVLCSVEKKLRVNGHVRHISGHGVAEDSMTAISKAFGEMLERIISGAYDVNPDILIAPPNELLKRFPALYPPQHHHFLDIQKERYRELQHDPSRPMDWMSGINLVTREKTYVPRHITSWFIKKHGTESPLMNATTSGSAGYFTKTGAILRGLLETIERDAFLVHWLTQIPPSIVMIQTLPGNIQEKIRQFESRGITVHVADVTALSIPSIIVIAINTETPQIVLSGASRATFEQAIRHSLREMAISSEMFYYQDAEKQIQQDTPDEPFVSTLGQISRQLYWRGPEKIQEFQWFLSGKRVSYAELCQRNLTPATDDAAQLKACLDVLKKRGPDYYPIAYFPKHPIQAKLGFYVAQVYVPKAFPLYLLECQGTFDSDRLEEFAASKGISKWELNPLPHMFS
jgi:ribosomal protein S12 methylthiotransferase accessory factor